MSKFVKLLIIIIIGLLIWRLIYIKISDDTNDVIVDNSYDTNIENQYGYAYWTPHGGFWQDIYFSTLSECEQSLYDRLQIGGKTNTEKCYQVKIIDAWCIDDIKTHKQRVTDSEPYKVYDITKTICTMTKEQCMALKKYQNKKISTRACFKTKVFNRESETLYLTPQNEIDEIINGTN